VSHRWTPSNEQLGRLQESHLWPEETEQLSEATSTAIKLLYNPGTNLDRQGQSGSYEASVF